MQIGWRDKMRKRKELIRESWAKDTELILEVLVDIRELLEDIKEGRRE